MQTKRGGVKVMQDTHSHFHAYHACRVIVKHWNVNVGNVVHSCFGQEKTLCKKVLVVEWRVPNEVVGLGVSYDLQKSSIGKMIMRPTSKLITFTNLMRNPRCWLTIGRGFIENEEHELISRIVLTI